MPQQKIFTADIVERLARNGAATRQAQAQGKDEPDHFPVLKVFNPYGSATWLITESEPDDPDILFGLCDLGMGYAELGSVRRSEIESLRIKIGKHELPLERDTGFAPKHALSVYTAAARPDGRITESRTKLDAALADQIGKVGQ